MQVVNWLPRTELPFAAPSRPELLETPEPMDIEPVVTAPVARTVAEPMAPVVARPKVEVPCPSLASTRPNAKPVDKNVEVPPKAPYVAPPRFGFKSPLAGRCALLLA